MNFTWLDRQYIPLSGSEFGAIDNNRTLASCNQVYLEHALVLMFLIYAFIRISDGNGHF